MPLVGDPSYGDSFAETRPEAAAYLKDMSFHTWFKVRDVVSDEEQEILYFADSLKGHGLCHHSIRDFQKCFEADPRAKERWAMGDLSLCSRQQFFAWTCMAKWTSLYLKECESEYYDVAKFGDRHNVSPPFLQMKNCVYSKLGQEATFKILFGDFDNLTKASQKGQNFQFLKNIRKKLESFTTRQGALRIRRTWATEDEPEDDSVQPTVYGRPRFGEGYGNEHLVEEGITHTKYKERMGDAPHPSGPGAADPKSQRMFKFGPSDAQMPNRG